MHGKYAVISLLLVGLGLLVAGLLRVEQRRVRVPVTPAVAPARPPVELTAARAEIEAVAARAKVTFRCTGDEFEHLAATSNARGEKTLDWRRFFAAGVNLGVALPGHYPTEFEATREDYARWLKGMGDAGFNVVRAYTILPPEFYQALAGYNFEYSDRPVYLIQGIWAEPPPGNDLFHAEYSAALKREIADAVDVVAGRAVLPERTGHASGAYSADVGAFTLGYLLGREWEPDAVQTTDTLESTHRRYDGVFLTVPDGTPTEVWLAGLLDFLVQYEVVTYGVQHPVAFVNWLPLDPMFHATEYTDKGLSGEYDNDLVTLDPRALQTTPAMTAGYYAAYHVYPYYPDFVFRDSAYRNFRNPAGEIDNYAAYLHDLKAHHAGLPLMVAEFGVPSSRGNSHHNGLGMDHGGHSETEQAALNLRMLRAIHEAGGAGGIFFAWLDEWFKRNWLVDDFSIPADRTRLWHNVQNPEQCYGLLKFGREIITLDGAVDDWTGRPLVQHDRQALRALWTAADEEYCYFRLDLAEPLDWTRHRLGLAIDTYDPELGDRRLAGLDLECAQGTEFLVLLRDTTDAEVLVDSGYSLFFDPAEPGRPRVRTLVNHDGVFIPEQLMCNHRRFAPDGETIPSSVTDYGRLRFGRSADNSLADWYAAGPVIEIRLPWALLNVTDPSSFQVLQNDTLTPDLESATTTGFAIAAFILDEANLAAALPPARNRTLQFSRRWRWTGWDEPAYTERRKQGYALVAAGLPAIFADSGSASRAAAPVRPVTARLAPFRADRSGAVSLVFDDGSYGQFTRAAPLLDRYGLKATFGLVANWTDAQAGEHAERDGVSFRRLGIAEAKQLLARGHAIAAHGASHDLELLNREPERIAGDVRDSRTELERALGVPVTVFHYPYSAVRPATVDAVRRAGFWFGRTADDRYNRPGEFDRYRLSSFAFYNDTLPGLRELQRILARGRDEWTILLNHHILEPDSRERELMARHNVFHTYSVTPLTFGRQVRLARNAGAWIAPVDEVGRYLLQYRYAQLDVRTTGQSASLKITGAEASRLPLVPMTVVLDIPWRWVAVTGSELDGSYSPYAGRLLLPVLPGREVTLRKLDPAGTR